MASINKGRIFVKTEGDFVVFLIGMRINSLWKIHKWLPVAMAMPKMIKELYKNKEHGSYQLRHGLAEQPLWYSTGGHLSTLRHTRKIKLLNIFLHGKISIKK